MLFLISAQAVRKFFSFRTSLKCNITQVQHEVSSPVELGS